jgi:hypothetical protein
MRTRQEYDTAIDAVRAVSNAWDLIRSLLVAVPRDEFEAEIASLATRIPRIHSPADPASQISEVFSAAFGPERFTLAACTDVGVLLYERLQKTGLLSTHDP